MKNDIVIELLKYGYENIQQGIEKEKTIEHLFGLKKSLFNISKKSKKDDNVKHIVNTYFDRNFFIPQDKDGNNIGNRYFLNPDGYFRYLQHKSIVLTRRYSTIAIIIAIASICITYLNDKPVRFSEKQMETLVHNDSIAINIKQDINTNLNEIRIDIGNLQNKIDTIENINWNVLRLKADNK